MQNVHAPYFDDREEQESLLSPYRTINIQVPILDEGLISKYTCGIRPIHATRPQIGANFVEYGGNLFLRGDCWGHGGAGITLAPGSAKMMWDRLSKILDDASGTTYKNRFNLLKDSIAIGGAGIMGLWVAHHFLEQGVPGNHITVYYREFENTTSYIAAGMWLPISMPRGGDDPRFFELLEDDSYKVYKTMANNPASEIKGVKELPLYTFNMHTEAQSLATRGLVPQGEKISLETQFGKIIENVMFWKEGFFLVDPFVLMPSLKKKLEERKVNFVFHTFKKEEEFFELKSPIFINCLGLGNKELSKEGEGANLRPSKGELVYLKPQDNIDHMLFGVLPSGRTFGYIPKADGLVIGVTRKPGDESLIPIPKDAKELIEIGRTFLGAPASEDTQLSQDLSAA